MLRQRNLYRKPRWQTTTALGVCLMLIGVGYAVAQSDKDKTKHDPRQAVIARVGERYITLGDFNRMLPRDPKNPAATLPPAKKKQLLDNLVKEWLFLSDAKTLKLAERPDVAARIDDVIDRVLVDEYVRQEILPSSKVTEAEVKSYWESNSNHFKSPPEVRARHILIAVSEKVDNEQARARAQEIHARLIAKEKFETLAAEYSDDAATKERGGDLGLFSRGKYALELESTAFTLKPGELSAPIKTAFGYHIVRVDERRESFVHPYESVREGLTAKLRQQKMQDIVQKRINELKGRIKTEVNPGLIDIEG